MILMEIQKIIPTVEERELLMIFYGEHCPEYIDFNWLMSLLNKIISLDEDKCYQIGGNQSGHICIIKGDNTVPTGWDLITGSGEGNSQIEAVYKAVVEFIKFYNHSKT